MGSLFDSSIRLKAFSNARPSEGPLGPALYFETGASSLATCLRFGFAWGVPPSGVHRQSVAQAWSPSEWPGGPAPSGVQHGFSKLGSALRCGLSKYGAPKNERCPQISSSSSNSGIQKSTKAHAGCGCAPTRQHQVVLGDYATASFGSGWQDVPPLAFSDASLLEVVGVEQWI